jgi:hypothetical protein
MLSKFFRKLKKQNNKNEKVKVDKAMRDYSKEEFFVKKAEIAQEILTKYGFPKEVIASK